MPEALWSGSYENTPRPTNQLPYDCGAGPENGVPRLTKGRVEYQARARFRGCPTALVG